MVISQNPRKGTNQVGENQNTVSLTSSHAGLNPKGFNAPNQINTIANEYLRRWIPHFWAND